MSALRLATKDGRRVGRTSKAERIAAAPATEAARLRRCLALIREEAARAEARAKAAGAVLEAAWLASGRDDRIMARAIAREAYIEARFDGVFGHLGRMCELAEEGKLCA
jgi:hypothetical protein